jgi:hypothetical protein
VTEQSALILLSTPQSKKKQMNDVVQQRGPETYINLQKMNLLFYFEILVSTYINVAQLMSFSCSSLYPLNLLFFIY